MVVPHASKFFEEGSPDLEQVFKGLDFEKVGSVTLSGNSFSTKACEWVAQNVLVKCSNLKKANFSDIFTTRLRSDLPHSLKLLIDAIQDKPIRELSLRDNAFGPDGVKSFE